MQDHGGPVLHSGPPPADGLRDPARESIFQRALPIYYALLLAILTVAGLYLLLRLRHVLIILFLSLLFAATVAKPAAFLERFRIPRAIAALLVYLASLAAIGAVGWLILPTLFNQVGRLGAEIPAYIERYNELRERYETLREEYPGLPSFDAQTRDVGASLTGNVTGRLARLPTNLFGLFLDILSVFAISMLLITERERCWPSSWILLGPGYDHKLQPLMNRICQGFANTSPPS